MNASETAEYLVGLANKAGQFHKDGEWHELQSLMEQVREKANSTTGEECDLFSVAEAFLSNLIPHVYNKQQLALMLFIKRYPNEVDRLYNLFMWCGSIPDELFWSKFDSKVNEELSNLIDLKIIRKNKRYVAVPNRRAMRESAPAWDLQPHLRNIARDMIKPTIIRHWEMVEKYCNESKDLIEGSMVEGDRYVANALCISPTQANYLRKLYLWKK